MGFENIWNNNGIGIAITGLTIVFIALTFISIFIYLLPKILTVLGVDISPEVQNQTSSAAQTVGNEEIAAAIGFVLHKIEEQKSRSS